MFSNSAQQNNKEPQNEYGVAIQRLKIISNAYQNKNNADLLKKFDETYLHDTKITNYISLNDLWKLGVDAIDHPYGRLSYDNGTNTSKVSEPGYINSMETALLFMFKTIEEELSPLYIKRLHFLCCADVSMDSGISSDCASENDVGSHFSPFGRCPLVTDCVTKEGLQEMAACSFVKAFCYSDDTITLAPETIDAFWNAMQAAKGRNGEVGVEFGNQRDTIFYITGEYKNNIANATTDDERILAIATFAQHLEWAHFFSDGNLRTIRVLILKLLIQNNLPLTCMKDPNIIDGHSVQQIANAIKEGMKAYQKIAPVVDITQGLSM